MATIYPMKVGPGRYRMMVEVGKNNVYGLCTCPEGHKTENDARECPHAKKTAEKYADAVCR